MTSDIIIQFNNIIKSLLNQLIPFIGVKYSNDFNSIISYNSLLPIEQFIIYALPLSDKIKNRDETYFTNNDYSDIENIDNNTLNEILRFKNIYKELDKVSISNIWDYLQVLLCLSEDYIKAKYK